MDPPSALRDPDAFASAVDQSSVPHEMLLISHPHGWSGLMALQAVVHANNGFVAVPDSVNGAAEFIAVQLGGRGRLGCRCDGRESSAWAMPGGVCVVPRGAPSAWNWSGTAIVGQVYLEAPLIASLVAEIGRSDPAGVELRHRFNERDPLVEQLTLALLGELRAGGAGGRLYAETVGRALGLHLLRAHSSLANPRELAGRGLTRAQLARALDYIQAQLHGPLGLDDLAAATGLSPWYFTRQFKRSTGLSPYQYVLRCRVERARDLLLDGNLTVADVAQRVGFAEQGQLGWHMKRLLGVLPRDIVASARISKQ